MTDINPVGWYTESTTTDKEEVAQMWRKYSGRSGWR